jgi:hypothetical protein
MMLAAKVEAVDVGGAEAGVGEGPGPTGERLVRGDGDAVLLFAFGEDLEERSSALRRSSSM